MDDRPSPASSTDQSRRGFWPWPGVVFALLGGQVVILVVALTFATRDRSFAVEPNYYQKALHWDAHVAQIRLNQAEGWHLSLDIAPTLTAIGQRAITVSVTDRNGHPIDAATVGVTHFHHARGQDRTTTNLTPSGNGCYSADLWLRRTGLWEFRLTVQRGSELFTAVECRDVAAPGGTPWQR